MYIYNVCVCAYIHMHVTIFWNTVYQTLVNQN